jgi:hypothetical protein
MAHHLAERIEALNSLDGEAKVDAEDEVADLIMRIWERRQGGELADDPLALADSVKRAVARLDPSARGPFSFYRPFEEKPGPSDAEIESNIAMQLALRVDDAARDLVLSLVKYAAQIAIQKDAEWVLASQAAGSSTLWDLTRLASLEASEVETGSDPIASERGRITQRAEAFSKVLQAMALLDGAVPPRQTSDPHTEAQ